MDQLVTINAVSQLRAGVFKLTRQLRKHATSLPYSHTELSIIGYLYQYGSLLPSEIAAMEKVSAQAISQSINHLQELNIISRTTHEGDKRKVRIVLTEIGRGKLQELRSSRDAWLMQAMQKCLSKKEAENLLSLVPVLEKLTQFNP